jgi:enamine deaminase RidA (YjgF/YER057c/UK114 family)
VPKVVTPKSFGTPLGLYSHGMVAGAGELVVVAGQVGIGPDGRVAGSDVVTQTRQAFENVRTVLQAAGCTMGDVIRLQTFLTRAEDLAGFMKARQDVFPEYYPNGGFPPNTLLVVSRLVRPELLVEIEAMAVRRATRSGARGRKATAKRKRARR